MQRRHVRRHESEFLVLGDSFVGAQQELKISPLDQYLVNEKAPHARELQTCKHLDLSRLCDINDAMADMGPKYMLYRFSEEKKL